MNGKGRSQYFGTSLLTSTSLESLSSPSPALPHQATLPNRACWICLGLTSSWLSRDCGLTLLCPPAIFTEAAKLLANDESNCRRNRLLWVQSRMSPRRAGLHLYFGIGFLQAWALLSQVYQGNQWAFGSYGFMSPFSQPPV